MTTSVKRLLLTGKLTRHGYSLDIAPRQETLHSCPVCERRYSRNDMRIVNGIFVCIVCAGDVQDESEEE